MKKVTIILTLSFSLIFSMGKTVAQSFNAGLVLGGTFSQVDGDSYYGYHQLGFTTGAYVNLPMAEHLAAQMELKYSLLGARASVKEIEEYGYNDFNLRLHYAEIPLMLRYDLGYFTVGGRPLDFITLEAGVSLDFRLKATEKVQTALDTDFEVTTSRWNFFSSTANAGVHFAVTDHLGIGARWMYSFLPIRFNGESPSYFYGHYYNKVWQFTLTYNINSPVR